jgi:hypothetical protein
MQSLNASLAKLVDKCGTADLNAFVSRECTSSVLIEFARLEDQFLRVPLNLSFAESRIPRLQIFMPRSLGLRQTQLKHAYRVFHTMAQFLSSLTDM